MKSYSIAKQSTFGIFVGANNHASNVIKVYILCLISLLLIKYNNIFSSKLL